MAAQTGSAVAKKLHAERMSHPTSMSGGKAPAKAKPVTKASASANGGSKPKFGSPEWRAKYLK